MRKLYDTIPDEVMNETSALLQDIDNWAEQMQERMYISRTKFFNIVHLIVKDRERRQEFLDMANILLTEHKTSNTQHDHTANI